MDQFLPTLVLILLALLGASFSFSTSSVPPGPRLVFRTGTHFLFLGLILGEIGALLFWSIFAWVRALYGLEIQTVDIMPI